MAMEHKVEKGKVGKFMMFSGEEKLLFLEALLFQLYAGLLLKVIPFRKIPGFFSNPSPLNPHSSPLTPDSSPLTPHPSLIILEEIKKAILRASFFSPWKNRCLVQSLAGRCMLRKRKIGSQLSLGVAHGQDKKLAAHAWLMVGDFEVVEKRGDFQQLYLF